MIGHAISQAAYAAPEDYFRDLERARTRALVERDFPLAWQLHAPEYMLVTPSGRTYTRERYLGLIESGDLNYRLWQLGDIAVRIAPQMAIVRYEVTIAFATDQGQGEPFKCWHTDSYELINGSWQAVWSQATKIS